MRAIKDFLVNVGGGIATGCGISGFIGQMMGVGATLALNPLLLLMGAVVGGAWVCILRSSFAKYSAEPLYVIVDNG
ncbi:hypothetical protein [Calothrix sp. CCY 0018]|uniref:hypothetical protein n=1 Tax=Calothrix sp. CCY 0018 TaxID=3103864 RepID=UPI0039C6A656